MAQISFWIDTVQAARSDQSVQQCTTLSSVIATEENVIFSPRQTACKARSAVLLSWLRQTVIIEVAERAPLIQNICECFSQPRFFRQPDSLLHHPLIQRCQSPHVISLQLKRDMISKVPLVPSVVESISLNRPATMHFDTRLSRTLKNLP